MKTSHGTQWGRQKEEGGAKAERERERDGEREGEEVMYLSLAFTPYQVCMPLSECVL